MRSVIVACAAVLAAVPASADVVASGPDHYTLRHEAISALSARDVWARLVEPARWWHPDHTYSGDAANLSLSPVAGGLWREDWPGGSVEHGRVLFAKTGETLRLDAPFGPLQSMGVRVVWTITVSPKGDGSNIVFDEVATGASASGLEAIAPAVDGVKQQAVERLAALR